MADDFRDSAHPRGDDGHARGHRFQKSIGRTLAQGRQDRDLSDAVVRLGRFLLPGQRDRVCEVQTANAFFDTGTLRPFSDDDQMRVQLGRQTSDRLQQGQMIFLPRKTADNQDYVPIRANPQLRAKRLGLIGLAETPAPIRRDGVMDDLDTFRIYSPRNQFLTEGKADCQHFARSPEGPPVKLVIEPRSQRGPSIAVVKGHPRRFAWQGRAPGEKMRLYRVGLDDIRP